jgi:hypothetical protein
MNTHDRGPELRVRLLLSPPIDQPRDEPVVGVRDRQRAAAARREAVEMTR